MTTLADESVATDYSKDIRVIEMQRMRLIASSLLALMLIIFLSTSILQTSIPWLQYPRAFAESAMIGACADWFAIVALFRHPLGIPIPHTAIVPNHKKQLAESFGEFITYNFLIPSVVNARLDSIDTAKWIGRWLSDADHKKMLVDRLTAMLPLIMEFLKEKQITAFSRTLINSTIDSIEAGPLIARTLNVLLDQGQHNAIFELGLTHLETFVGQHRQNINQRVSENSSKWLPAWVDHKVTDAFLNEFLETLRAAKALNHPWRIEFKKWIMGLSVRLANNQDAIEQCERIKSEVLHSSVVEGYFDWMVNELDQKIQTEITHQEGIVSQGLQHAIAMLADWLQNDLKFSAMINNGVKLLVVNIIVPNREEIGTFVSDVVERWDSKTLVDKIELRVGKDLQFIRINGTVVGGLVGLTIFILTQLVK